MNQRFCGRAMRQSDAAVGQIIRKSPIQTVYIGNMRRQNAGFGSKAQEE